MTKDNMLELAEILGTSHIIGIEMLGEDRALQSIKFCRGNTNSIAVFVYFDPADKLLTSAQLRQKATQITRLLAD